MPPARRTITAANWIAWVSRWLAVWVALGFLPPAAAESGRPAIEHYTYEETTGSHAIPIEYVVQIPKRSLSTVDAIFGSRIDVSPSGPLAFVWHGSYWFRQPDGVFLQYAGGHLLSEPKDTFIRIRTEADP